MTDFDRALADADLRRQHAERSRKELEASEGRRRAALEHGLAALASDIAKALAGIQPIPVVLRAGAVSEEGAEPTGQEGWYLGSRDGGPHLVVTTDGRFYDGIPSTFKGRRSLLRATAIRRGGPCIVISDLLAPSKISVNDSGQVMATIWDSSESTTETPLVSYAAGFVADALRGQN